jgi:hypothetical protein
MSRRKSDNRSGAPKAVQTAASDRKASGKRTSGRNEDEDEDEDEEEDDEDDEEEDDEDEDEDEEEDDEDDEEEDEPPSARTRHVRSTEEDWIPNWAPWLVLIAILSAGLAGLLGLFGSPEAPTIEQIDSATSPAKTSSATKPRSDSSRRAADGHAERIDARQIVVAYQGARRAPSDVTRSKQEARARAQEVLAKARAGADFQALVAQYSDESGSATRGGRVGKFTRRQKVKAFSDAAFALRPGQFSDVVETPFGYHVIQRTD